MSDNGGEFSDNDFKKMCEANEHVYQSYSSKSPFSIGFVERHNMIIGNTLEKLLTDQQFNLDLALAWCFNAENLLASINRF